MIWSTEQRQRAISAGGFTLESIVVGVDQSQTARRAAFVAAKLASNCNKPLHIVMAVSRRKALEVAGGGSDRWHLDWISSAEQFLDELIGELPADHITRTVSLKDPATALCEEAERLEASVIVVGNRRVQGASRLLGAVATDVARRAPCDVLIANTTSERPED
jgi:nucleotide-binding universal stress UspA family protein